MRRRRMIIALALMVVIGSWMTWRITHRHDPRLVGKWLFTQGAAPTIDELRWESDQSHAGIRIEWTFDPDGTGKQHWFYSVPSIDLMEFTWWTDGERVYVKFGRPHHGWAAFRAIFNDFLRTLRGETLRSPDVYTYGVANADNDPPQQFRLRFQNEAQVQSDDVYYLTRIPAE